MIKQFLTNSAIYGLSPYIPRIISVFLLPLLTAHLTEIDYGIAGTIAAYTLALSAFSSLGFSVVLQISFFHSRCQYKILWREIYGFLQYWMVLFAVVQGTILYCIIPDEALDNRWLIILLTNFNGVFGGPSALLGPTYYQYEQKPLPIAIRNIVSGMITVLSNYICIVLFEWGYMGWYVSTFVGTFVVNISYWYDLNFKLHLQPIYRFKVRTIKNSLKVSLPTIPHYYSMFLLNTSNRMVMDRVGVSISRIREFNMAQQFATLMESTIYAINMAVNPMCMNAIRNNDESESKRIIYLFFMTTLSLTFLFCIWSKEIFSLLIHNEVLANTYPYAAILIMALNYRPMYIAASNIFFYHEKTISLLYITFVAGIIALIANIVFIPFTGLWGAVVVNYISFLYMGYSGFFMKFFREKSKVEYPFIRLMFVQVVASILCVCLLEQPILYKLFFSLCYMLLVLVAYLKLVKK